MGFGFFEDRAVRRGLPLVIVGLDVVAPHGMVFELVPHQNTTEIGMADEGDAEEVEDFAFLKFAGAPNGRERGDGSLVGAVAGAAVRPRVVARVAVGAVVSPAVVAEVVPSGVGPGVG
jgi:hypothetical protein